MSSRLEQGRAIRIGYCIVFTILVSIGFTQYLLWVLLFSQYNTIQQFFLGKIVKYREYPAKRDKRKRHNSAMEKDISNLKKVLESPMKTILPCFDKFLPPVGLDSP